MSEEILKDNNRGYYLRGDFQATITTYFSCFIFNYFSTILPKGSWVVVRSELNVLVRNT